MMVLKQDLTQEFKLKHDGGVGASQQGVEAAPLVAELTLDNLKYFMLLKIMILNLSSCYEDKKDTILSMNLNPCW